MCAEASTVLRALAAYSFFSEDIGMLAIANCKSCELATAQ
jgi:hypothetical protein